MKHQQQGYHECLPTAIAMVLDLPKDIVVRVAELGARCSFSSMEDSRQMREAVRAIRFVFDAEWFKHEGATNTLFATPLEPGEVCTMFRHVGAAIVYGHHGSHVVAFDHGMIHDPSLPAPMPLPDYVRLLHDQSWEFSEIHIKE